MRKQHNKITSCKVCQRATNNAYICRRCANELRDLLIGSRESDGQPGIVWYVKRLRESAYGQTKLGRSLSVRPSATGYALLGNKHAADLLGRINGLLARWEAVCERLRATQSHENGWLHQGSPTKDFERLETVRARFIAANVTLIRHHRSDADRLHAELLDCARQAWRIINRPNDLCCGPCPTMLPGPPPDTQLEQQCGTLLYAEEGATGVQCPLCHTMHHVQTLRDMMKAQVADMLFTRAELVNLMATRLNDPIKQPLFTKLLRTKRLQPREIRAVTTDSGELIHVPMFTYNDVCAARLRDNRKAS